MVTNILFICLLFFYCTVLVLKQGLELEIDLPEADAGVEGEDDLSERKTLKEKLQTVQEITALVQNVLGEIASLGERVKK